MSCLAERPAYVPRSRACDALGLSRTGTYPRKRPSRAQPDTAASKQPRQLSEAEVAYVLETVNSATYRDEAVRVIHARELNQGRPLPSVSSIYRILRRRGQSRERRNQRPPQRHVRPQVIVRAPNQGWSWDISKLPTTRKGVYLNLYEVLDLFSRYPVAWMVSRKENGGLAQHLFRHALERHAIEPGALVVHQDRGAPMIAQSYREFLDSHGVRRSYSRPRVSNDNPFSEAHFKTLKYSPGYPGRFEGIDHAREWLAAFMEGYKHRPHEGLGYYTPAEVFEGRAEAVRVQRQAALDAYYESNTGRFPRGRPIANKPPQEVAINPEEGVAQSADAFLKASAEALSTPTPKVDIHEENEPLLSDRG
ncbi:IS3 family transposase [Halorhodospira neutriphila]|uniref:Integrase catalytic domain-containing protein n=1 Tax=Halorhodospira neutriphila TaxID=168379 RepID=A0ABS1E9M4_9GAMM|nr:IS3 family transposase [Halorhodospira neutriphila]MBK1727300.1 hypothetical protein [Halorhodospira neutriphila]